MRRLAALTSLLIAGSALTAAAQPGWHRYRNRDREWVQLLPAQSAQNDVQTITLNGRHDRMHMLRITAVRGAPVITRVTIDYLDQQPQVISLNSRIGRGGDEVIRLDARAPIQRITIYTEPRYGGAYTVFGT